MTTSGGFFEVATNGTCVDPQVFSIFDAVGLQTTAQLFNLAGTAAAPVEPVNVLSGVSPTSIALDEQSLYVASDPGSTNEKKGVIKRYALSVIPTP